MRKGKKMLGLLVIALVTATTLMTSVVIAEDWTETGKPPEMFDWMDEPTTTNQSGAGLIILVIILFGGSLVAIYLVDKHLKTEKRIEVMERQLKEKA